MCYVQFLLDVCQIKGWFLEFSYAVRKPKAPEIEDKGGITTLSNLLLGKGAPSKTVKLIQIRKSWPQNQTVPGENTPKNDRKICIFSTFETNENLPFLTFKLTHLLLLFKN